MGTTGFAKFAGGNCSLGKTRFSGITWILQAVNTNKKLSEPARQKAEK